MKTIFNAELLDFPPDKLERLENDAMQRRRFFSMTFSIVAVDGDQVIIRTKQNKPFHENVADVNDIIRVTRSLFEPFLPGKTIQVHPVTYQESPPDVVTPEWIEKRMSQTKMKLKDLVAMTGIEKSTLSGIINGHKPLSQPMKALFFYVIQVFERNKDEGIPF